MLGLYEVFYAGYIFLRLITMAILIYCVLSWFRPRFRAFDMLGAFIRPFVAPFQGLSMKLRQYFHYYQTEWWEDSLIRNDLSIGKVAICIAFLSGVGIVGSLIAYLCTRKRNV